MSEPEPVITRLPEALEAEREEREAAEALLREAERERAGKEKAYSDAEAAKQAAQEEQSYADDAERLRRESE